MGKNMFALLMSVCVIGLSGCASIPKNATVVEGFDVTRYMGTWYEIARFDFRFERGLDHTTAEYALNADNTVKVVNRGYNPQKDVWKEAKGKARFRGASDKGALEVSFFGPFYAGYNILALEDYRYALVCGSSTKYLWILSREKTIPEEVRKQFLKIASDAGFPTSDLIWVNQE
ncbi:MAG: lipocalin family protein [Sphaerochaetaceae bacterium]